MRLMPITSRAWAMSLPLSLPLSLAMSLALLLTISLAILPAPALAGGDHVRGVVTDFSGADGNYAFTFTQKERKDWLLIPNCPTFKMQVRYQRIHWSDWLPFTNSTHPTRKQTLQAGVFLAEAAQQRKSIGFGFLGRGLVATQTACSFISKGLLQDGDVVIGFYHPV